VEFEPTIPVFERAKTVHASDRAAIVIGVTPIVAQELGEAEWHGWYKGFGVSDRAREDSVKEDAS
jgi:hypothetical protein